MSDWSISKRLNVLSALLAGAMLLVTALGIGAALRLAAVSTSLKESAADMLVVVRTQEDALEAQGYELRYRHDLSADAAALAVSNLDEILDLEGDLAAFVADDPVGRASIADVVAEIGDYRRLFDESHAFQDEREAFVAEAEAREDELGAQLDAILSVARASGAFDTLGAAADAKDGILSAVIAFKHFLLGNDPAEFDEMVRQVEVARTHLDVLADGPSGAASLAATQARDGLAAYVSAATGAKEAIISRNQMREELDRLAADVLSRLNTALDVEVERQDALILRGQLVLRTTIVLLAAISLAAVGASIALAIASARSVRSSIEGSVAEMQELANGNLDVRITGADRNHELGRMAQALEVFRTNAIAAKETEARQREQERLQRERDAERDRREADAAETQRRAAEAERREVIRSLQSSIGEVVDGAAAGDFSRRITARFAEDEFNRMADAINRLMSNVETGVTEVARVMSRVAAGDLTERVGGDLSGLFAELKANVNETIDTLARIVDDIAEESFAVVGEVVSMAHQADDLARRAEQQAASLEETTAAMEQISSSTRLAAEGATSASEFAARTTGRVDEAGRVVATAVEAMDGIRNASARIGEIVSVIDGIAFQTNLLALNASVEAARAGAAGKGFSVVATEVRALAQRSGSASQDIKALIDESSAQVENGVALVERTGSTLQEIVEGVRGMADSLGKFVETGKEQASSIQEVSAALSQLDVITQKNAGLADRSREQTAGVKRRTETMRDLVAAFRTPASQTRAPSSTVDDASKGDAAWEAA
jgi:methyl-accepting chemotaxis protein